MNDKFKGHIYVDSESQLLAFQVAALNTGLAITISPMEDGKYKIEFLKYDKQDI